jgi:hypothetical protein
MDDAELVWERNLRRLTSWAAVAGAMAFASVFFGRITYLAFTENFWKEISREHFPSVIGLPAAALLSLLIVLVLKAAAGPLRFKVPGFEFKGASGPVILWVVCFLAMSWAIHFLWDLKSASGSLADPRLRLL